MIFSSSSFHKFDSSQKSLSNATGLGVGSIPRRWYFNRSRRSGSFRVDSETGIYFSKIKKISIDLEISFRKIKIKWKINVWYFLGSGCSEVKSACNDDICLPTSSRTIHTGVFSRNFFSTDIYLYCPFAYTTSTTAILKPVLN